MKFLLHIQLEGFTQRHAALYIHHDNIFFQNSWANGPIELALCHEYYVGR